MNDRILLVLAILSFCSSPAQAQLRPHVTPVDTSLVQWIQSNTSPVTGFPLSFDIENSKRADVLKRMGELDSVTGI
ncbi:MAG: hypothetical protein K8I00_10520, partial [Candidatus Omnitrophica bacterium]|nr:hypothetical protein [Candidatus Omnitrophota bacterium]